MTSKIISKRFWGGLCCSVTPLAAELFALPGAVLGAMPEAVQ